MIARRARLVGVLFSAAMLLGTAAGQQLSGRSGPMNITSSAFAQNGAIPKKYTCDGGDTSPPVAWSDVPAGAKSLALIVDDPDAPDPAAPRMTWVHWVLYNLPPSSGGLAEGVKNLPAGTAEGMNGRHRYFHKLYALDTVLQGLKKPGKAALEKAMQGHVIARAELIGTYQR